MEENNIIPEEESSIDFKKIFQDLKKYKKLYLKVLGVAAVVAVIYTLSLPNFYKVTVKLSPELSSKRSSSSLASMASMFGVNISGAAGNGTEALFPTLYPDLMNSVAFHTTLFPIKVHRDSEDKVMTYYDYLLKEQKAPWWSEAMGATTKAIGSLFSGEKKSEPAAVDPFRLTQKQAAIVKAMKQRIVCDVDKKTMVITIDVTDQDPLIAATMADSVQQRLQDFITDYRTKKARNDLEFSRKAFEEAQQRYEHARRRYASFSDSNQRLFLESLRSEQEKLSQELAIQSQVYTQASAQLQQAELDVQRETPAFTVLEPATVPVRKASPARAKMCLVFLFLAFLGTTVYALYKEDDLKPLLGMN
jgi:uncharacterized protein involved in exopolysaccharide biosynthesis